MPHISDVRLTARHLRKAQRQNRPAAIKYYSQLLKAIKEGRQLIYVHFDHYQKTFNGIRWLAENGFKAEAERQAAEKDRRIAEIMKRHRR